MSTAIFEYKCRRCGDVDASTITGAQAAGMKLVSAVTGLQSDPMLPMLSVHRCGDYGEGVTDLIGYRVEEPRSNQ